MAELTAELERLGYELLRDTGPHRIYQNANGARVVVAKTSSDWRATANTIADARRLAGLGNQGKEARVGVRRKRRRGQPPAAVDPRAAGPAIPDRPREVEPQLPRPVVGVVEQEQRRNVPVQIRNIADHEPKPKVLPQAPIAHIRAVDALPKGMRDRVLKLAKGDYTKIKILADNRVEVTHW